MKPTDNLAYRYPVSIKGVIFLDGDVILLKNERNEFELPGGKLEVHEQPPETLVREIKEELSIDVEIVDAIDSWLYHIDQETHVVIITYLCKMCNNNAQIQISSEHKQLGIFALTDLVGLNIPSGYVDSIYKAAKRESHYESQRYQTAESKRLID